MQRAKRDGDDERVSGCFLMDSTQDVWAGLSARQISYLSKSVASIALCNGDAIIFSCSGIAMERHGSTTRFLTSAALGRELYHQNRDRRKLKIRVRHEGNEVYSGRMDEYDLERNFAVVSISGFIDAQVESFQRALEILPHGEVLLAVGRGVSGKIMTKSVELNGEDDEDLDCNKSHKAWEGGPVLFADHVVGMNLCLTTRRAIFRPWGTILKHLEHCWTSQQMLKVFRFGARPMGEKSITYPHIVQGYYFKKDLLDLNSKGYPKLPSTMLGTGMILVNTFEDKFVDNQGVWNKLGKRVSNIDRNVVALAAFKEGKRFFACSGFFIQHDQCATILTSASLVRNPEDEKKIVENLRIKVFIQENLCIEGTLQDYNLHCNVALVSVKGYQPRRPLNTMVATDHFEVAAVGRCFDNCQLMATGGDMVHSTGTLDCSVLRRSTCKITKLQNHGHEKVPWNMNAGIGGPLVNLDGDVVGMNFYDTRIGTPYLPWKAILTVLSWFATKRKPGDVGYIDNPFGAPFWQVVENKEGVLNSWPVPKPHWRHPDFVDGDASDEFFSEPRSGTKRKYTYVAGVKFMYF